MGKLDEKVEDELVDGILDVAIEDVESGLEEFSCCALTIPGDLYQEGWLVRRVYSKTFTDNVVPHDNYGHAFSEAVLRFSPSNKQERRELRVLLLSLFKAAWRDLV